MSKIFLTFYVFFRWASIQIYCKLIHHLPHWGWMNHVGIITELGHHWARYCSVSKKIYINCFRLSNIKSFKGRDICQIKEHITSRLDKSGVQLLVFCHALVMHQSLDQLDCNKISLIQMGVFVKKLVMITCKFSLSFCYAFWKKKVCHSLLLFYQICFK